MHKNQLMGCNMEINKKEIGKIIDDGLKRMKISKVEFAREMGVDKSTVTLWCQGKVIPPGDKLLKIILSLNLTGDLFANTYSKNDEVVTRKEFEKIYNATETCNAAISEIIRKLSTLEQRINSIQA